MSKIVIFDLDGVLVEAKDWHYEALNLALAVFGCCTDRMWCRPCTELHDLHGSVDAQTCTETFNRTFQLTDLHGCVQLPFSIHGFAHHCTEAS